MKKAFTLIELMVVVVIIAILASITFKIANLGEDTSKRNTTIARMQRLENAISGYFAAYGSYPPVALQGRSRNIFYKVNGYGIQQVTDSPDTSEIVWGQVEAACRAQPVAMEFPYASSRREYVKAVSDALMEQYNSGDADFKKEHPALAFGFDALNNPQSLSEDGGGNGVKKGDWTNIQIFKFGLMSYLLPRYLLMMGHGNGGSTSLYDDFAQWGDNNSIPCRFEDGVQYKSWSDLNSDFGKDNEKWKIALIPSQAICARWLANLEGLLLCNDTANTTVYGVNFRDTSRSIGLSAENPNPNIYSASGGQSGQGANGSQQYVLNKITCQDGWKRDFYYYSLPPYQSYRLWSAGENGKTFPPWIPDEEIEKYNKKDLIRNWIADDIVHMSN